MWADVFRAILALDPNGQPRKAGDTLERELQQSRAFQGLTSPTTSRRPRDSEISADRSLQPLANGAGTWSIASREASSGVGASQARKGRQAVAPSVRAHRYTQVEQTKSGLFLPQLD